MNTIWNGNWEKAMRESIDGKRKRERGEEATGVEIELIGFFVCVCVKC